MRRILALIFLPLLGGCFLMGRDDSESRSDMSSAVRRSDLIALESSTLSRLVDIEHGLDGFVHSEGRIPQKLEELVPKYLAEIPDVALGLRWHGDNNRVHNYPPAAIINGQVDGAVLKDTGSWGYVHNDRQVIVFVDCTHKNMNGQLWYQVRGAH